MGKGKRRAEQERAKEEARAQDLATHKGLSKYERKKMAQRGIDVNKIIGGTP